MTNPMTWCEECHRHKFKCMCDLPKNIYVVEYRLVIELATVGAWCEELVRCIAYDFNHAREAVLNWALTTDRIWWRENGTLAEHTVPLGARDVTILRIDKYMENVGPLLKELPMPEIFEYEE